MVNIIELFFKKRFLTHRLMGLLYILQFLMAIVCEFLEIAKYSNLLLVSLPLTGLSQAIIACLTFKTLPSTQGKIQGYFTDKRTMSYDFILENVFFAMLLFFQAFFYYTEKTKHPITNYNIYNLIILIFVFFPYYIIRPFFPKTSFRKTINNKKERTDKNDIFLVISTYSAKMFYNIAKHINGYLVNYLIYLGKFPDISGFRVMCLMAGWGTTVAVFLHTLKFKKIIGPRLAVSLYVIVFPMLLYSYAMLCPLFIENKDLLFLCILGLFTNYSSKQNQIMLQTINMIYCMQLKYQFFDTNKLLM